MRTLSAWRIAGLLLVAWALVGCATPFRSPVFDPPEASFPGLAQIAADEPNGALDLFLVHGMCHHDAEWATSWLQVMASALGTTAELDAFPAAQPAAEIKVYRATMKLKKGLIRAHAVVWSGLTKPLKDQLCYDQTNKSRSCLLPSSYPKTTYPYPRAKLNALLKDDLLNDCFSDAVIYQGAARLGIVRQMQAALLESRAASVKTTQRGAMSIASASLANDSGLVVLSSSLGSKLVFDAILELTKLNGDNEAAGVRLRDSTRQVFMAANQIPLLSLGDQDIGGLSPAALDERSSRPGVFPPDPLDTLMRQRGLPTKTMRMPSELSTESQPKPAVKVVALTDPNDLLSYALRGYYAQRGTSPAYEVVDVIVSNASTLIGLIENPYTAHTGYLETQPAARSIVCGRPEAQRCP